MLAVHISSDTVSEQKPWEGQTMAYDLLIKNGRVIDGSGLPAFRGDVAVSNGKIVATGKLRDSATRTIDADGLVVTPGFIDNHCHYDAQVTWDPLCTFSCYHGATASLSETAPWPSPPCASAIMRSSSACCRKWKRSRWMSCKPEWRGTGRAFPSIWTCSTKSSVSTSAR